MKTKTVQRHDLQVGMNVVPLPVEFSTLCVMGIREVARLFIVVPSEYVETVDRRVEVSGTGNPVDVAAAWISTFSMGGAEYHAWLHHTPPHGKE